MSVESRVEEEHREIGGGEVLLGQREIVLLLLSLSIKYMSLYH